MISKLIEVRQFTYRKPLQAPCQLPNENRCTVDGNTACLGPSSRVNNGLVSYGTCARTYVVPDSERHVSQGEYLTFVTLGLSERVDGRHKCRRRLHYQLVVNSHRRPAETRAPMRGNVGVCTGSSLGDF